MAQKKSIWVQLSSGEYSLIFLILLLAFSLRLLTALCFEASSERIPYLGFDESVYYSLAHHMRHTSPFAYTLHDAPLFFQTYRVWYLDQPLFHHPPLFSWSLMAVQFILGSGFFGGRLLNVFLGTVGVYVTYLLGKRLSPRVGILSALLLSLSPLHIQLSAFVLMEMMLSVLVSVFLLYAIKTIEDGRLMNAVGAGMILGLGLLTKYTMALTLPALAFLALRRKMSESAFAIILFTGGLIFSFWVVLNVETYDISTFIHNWKMITEYGNSSQVPFYAYLVFLPVVAPTTILSYISLLRCEGRGRGNEFRTMLIIVCAGFTLFHMVHPIKDMRLILPVLPPLLILGSDFLASLPRRFLFPILISAVAVSSYASLVIVSGGYLWYLDFWHYRDWYGYFLNPFGLLGLNLQPPQT
jgi:4-amino-4-deoxy-L-arabinose transferase-like glycosyltransferase